MFVISLQLEEEGAREEPYPIVIFCGHFMLLRRSRLELMNLAVQSNQMFTYVSQLCLIHSRSRWYFIVSFIPSKCIYLQLIQIHFWQICVRFIAIILGIFSTSSRPGILNSCLMKITDVDMCSCNCKTRLWFSKICFWRANCIV